VKRELLKQETNMQAIEFKAKSYDGLINIPDTYKNWYNNTVVLLTKPKPLPQETGHPELKRFFVQFNADLTGYRFNREAANER